MALNITIDHARFSPAEVEKITGVSATLQRDWRRRGLLPERRTGWTQVEPEGLICIALMKALGDVGMGPALAKDIAAGMAPRVLTLALREPGATAEIRDVSDEALTENTRRMIAGAGEFKTSVGAVIPRFLAFDGETTRTGDTIDQLFGSPGAADTSAAFLVIDLLVVASAVVQRAGRPLITKRVFDDGSGPPKRGSGSEG